MEIARFCFTIRENDFFIFFFAESQTDFCCVFGAIKRCGKALFSASVALIPSTVRPWRLFQKNKNKKKSYYRGTVRVGVCCCTHGPKKFKAITEETSLWRSFWLISRDARPTRVENLNISCAHPHAAGGSGAPHIRKKSKKKVSETISTCDSHLLSQLSTIWCSSLNASARSSAVAYAGEQRWARVRRCHLRRLNTYALTPHM